MEVRSVIPATGQPLQAAGTRRRPADRGGGAAFAGALEERTGGGGQRRERGTLPRAQTRQVDDSLGNAAQPERGRRLDVRV